MKPEGSAFQQSWRRSRRRGRLRSEIAHGGRSDSALALHQVPHDLAEVVIVVEGAVLGPFGFHVHHTSLAFSVPNLEGGRGRGEPELQQQQGQSQPAGTRGAVA